MAKYYFRLSYGDGTHSEWDTDFEWIYEQARFFNAIIEEKKVEEEPAEIQAK